METIHIYGVAWREPRIQNDICDDLILLPICTWSSKRKGVKFGEGGSVRADWLCIGCPRLVGRRKVGIFKWWTYLLHEPVILTIRLHPFLSSKQLTCAWCPPTFILSTLPNTIWQIHSGLMFDAFWIRSWALTVPCSFVPWKETFWVSQVTHWPATLNGVPPR